MWTGLTLLVCLLASLQHSWAMCTHDGLLLPNPDNCRKYIKCAQGAPSPQNCPGTLVFDPVLSICNWPDNVICAVKAKRVKLVLGDDGELSIGDAGPTAPTAPPRTAEDKKRLQSLFHTKDRDFTRIRANRVRHRNRDTTSAPPTTARNRGAQTDSSRVRPFRISSSSGDERRNSFSSSGDESRNSFSSSGDERRNSFSSPSDERRNSFSSSENRRNPFEAISVDELKNRRNRVRPSDEEDEGRRPFTNRGGGPIDEEEVLREEFFSEEEEPVVVKPKSKPIVCHTGASNELYANPRNCRKYYKCHGGKPSLQSCPANLIFDTNLRICNWPTASSCVEDPDAVLPDHVSSDRAPPKPRDPAFNIINVDDDYEDSFHGSSLPSSSLPSPFHGSVPSKFEALEREHFLTEQYPLFKDVIHTVSTLDNDLVEEIMPGKADNPDNVRRVEFIVTEENYDDLFPRRHSSYTYRRLLQAVGKFPAICGYLGREDNSDTICRKTLATMFAHFAQETGAHNPSDKEYEEWRQGLNEVREQGCTETSPGCGYNSNCEDQDSITKKWACGEDRSGKWKKYYGRGAKQLSYNFNYGQFSQAMFGEGRLLLDYPDFVADTWLNLASATWFYTTPQPPKPSMLHVIDGTWQPNEVDRRNGIKPGFGVTINIINGGLECNTIDGRESNQAKNRIAYYKKFAWYLYVDFENEELGCADQEQFSAGGAGALPVYWDKDWASPYSCKLVNYQTAHSALVEGEYVDCVEENFKVTIN